MTTEAVRSLHVQAPDSRETLALAEELRKAGIRVSGSSAEIQGGVEQLILALGSAGAIAAAARVLEVWLKSRRSTLTISREKAKQVIVLSATMNAQEIESLIAKSLVQKPDDAPDS